VVNTNGMDSDPRILTENRFVPKELVPDGIFPRTASKNKTRGTPLSPRTEQILAQQRRRFDALAEAPKCSPEHLHIVIVTAEVLGAVMPFQQALNVLRRPGRFAFVLSHAQSINEI